MIILICGFMGSGKTTLSKKWKEEVLKEQKAQWEFADLDQIIFEKYKEENETGLSEVILRLGWQKFREYESNELNRLLHDEDELVISLGGGSLESKESRQNISKNSNVKMVFLDTSFEECWRRVSQEEGRPLVESGKDSLKELYESRLPQYKMADVSLKSSESGITLSQLITRLN
tara:strand:- start:56327 stop:56851 length:525 start_codon:yes stop_codon:yes gene_type:complete